MADSTADPSAPLGMTTRRQFTQPSEARWRALLLGSYALLTFLREPWLLIHGRLWAEEGPVYFRYAWSASPWQALGAAHLGYYSLWSNVCSWLEARAVPIAWAPLLSTWLALIVQLLAGYLVVECELFRTVRENALALAVLLFTAPSLEIWLNLINSQFYWCLCVALVLFSRPARLPVLRNLTLATAGLTGPVSTYLAPLFWVRAWRLRCRAAWLQAGILTLCGVVEGIVVLRSLRSATREIHFHPEGMGAALVAKVLVLPFLSRAAARPFGRLLTERLPTTAPWLALWSAVAIVLLALLAWTLARAGSACALMPFGVALWCACLSIYGALDQTIMLAASPTMGGRYFYVPNVLIGLALVLAASAGRASETRARRAQVAARVLLVLFLFSGLMDFEAGRIAEAKDRPLRNDWAAEVGRWRRDPCHALQEWPKGWTFTLAPNHSSENGACPQR